MSDDRYDDAPGAARRLLRWVSALLLLSLMAGAGHQILRWEPRALPILVVTVDGELRRLSPQRLQQSVIDHLHGGIVTQDLGTLKDALEGLAWVRSASLRRLWPDRLAIAVEEHEPLARWGEDGLVSVAGVVFRPPGTELPRGLPRLRAADSRAEELVSRFQSWQPRFESRGIAIDELRQDARGAWSLRTDAGFELALGKLDVEGRVARFLSAWPSLAAAGRPATVDMRYSNGLAVSWGEDDADRDAAGEASARAGTGTESGTPWDGGRRGAQIPSATFAGTTAAGSLAPRSFGS